MEGIIRHEANNSYLIMKEETISDREEFILRMITENQIPGLLQATRNQLDAEGEIYYNVNSYVSFSEYCGKKQLGLQELKKLFFALQEILKQLEAYLLDADSLLLDPETLFLSTNRDAYAFCLYPFIKRNIRRQIQDLAEYLLNHINHEDEKVVRAAYQFYRFTREENFEIQQVVEELIRDINSLDMNERPDRIKGANEMDIEYSTQSETEKVKKYSTDTPSPIDRTASANRKLTVNLNFFFICLSLASFSFFVYTCIIKNYYYGYSFISILSTKEVRGSLFFFAVTCLFTFVFIWRHKAKIKKEVVEVSGA